MITDIRTNNSKIFRSTVIDWMVNDGLIDNRDSRPDLVDDFLNFMDKQDFSLNLEKKYLLAFIQYLKVYLD